MVGLRNLFQNKTVPNRVISYELVTVWVLFMGSQLMTSTSWAHLHAARTLAEQETISADLIQAYNELHDREKRFDPSVLVPSNAQSMEGKQVIKAMADKSLQLWWQSEEVKSSSFGRQADKVEKTMQQDVTIKEKSGVSHNVKFQVMPVQTTARIDYTGYTNARLFYTATEAASGVEIFEPIGTNKQITIGEVYRDNEQLSQISWSMNW